MLTILIPGLQRQIPQLRRRRHQRKNLPHKLQNETILTIWTEPALLQDLHLPLLPHPVQPVQLKIARATRPQTAHPSFKFAAEDSNVYTCLEALYSCLARLWKHVLSNVPLKEQTVLALPTAVRIAHRHSATCTLRCWRLTIHLTHSWLSSGPATLMVHPAEGKSSTTADSTELCHLGLRVRQTMAANSQ